MNLLLIVCDEMRAHDMGCAGNQEVRTPNMDGLEGQGTRFENAISNCPVCTPARGSLLTGMHALGHHAVANDMLIRTDRPTIARSSATQAMPVATWGNGILQECLVINS